MMYRTVLHERYFAIMFNSKIAKLQFFVSKYTLKTIENQLDVI